MRFKWLVICLVLLGLINYWRPLPQPTPAYDLKSLQVSQTAKIAWPASGQAAVGAVGYGLLAESPNQTATPMASTAKLMTALAIIRQQPTEAGAPSRNLKFTASDVDLYRKYLANNGSVVTVKIGDKMTDYQALQAMLIPSGNNIADSLAIQRFGSIKNYVVYANQLAKQLGMSNSRFADASGFSSKTTSTAHDAVLLIGEALKSPIIGKIIGQKQFSFDGHIYKSTNWLLGVDGINGIKTGHTDAAGGCYLFSANRTVLDKKVMIFGAVLGSSDLGRAIISSIDLLSETERGFETVQTVKQGDVVAHYDFPWGGRAEIIAQNELSVLNWRGQVIQNQLDLPTLKSSTAVGANIGKLSATAGQTTTSTAVTLKANVEQPSFFWRLFRI